MFSYGANIRNPSVFHNREGSSEKLTLTLIPYYVTNNPWHKSNTNICNKVSKSKFFRNFFLRGGIKNFLFFFENLVDGMKERDSLITTPRIPWRIGWYPPGSSVSAG